MCIPGRKSAKKNINFPWTRKKLQCKLETYRSSGLRYLKLQTDKHSTFNIRVFHLWYVFCDYVTLVVLNIHVSDLPLTFTNVLIDKRIYISYRRGSFQNSQLFFFLRNIDIIFIAFSFYKFCNPIIFHFELYLNYSFSMIYLDITFNYKLN